MGLLEIEVKFLVTDVPLLHDRILKTGAESKGRYFETNIRFEDKKDSLVQNKSLLRLRRDRKSTLTFKREAFENNGQFKIHREWEVVVDDFQAMVSILQSLGFHAVQTYEKWRETFTIDGTVLCLDTMPFGNFLEIEGEKECITNLAEHLKLRWNERILLNYLAMFERIKTQTGLDFNDITFDNFKDTPITPDECRQLFCSPAR